MYLGISAYIYIVCVMRKAGAAEGRKKGWGGGREDEGDQRGEKRRERRARDREREREGEREREIRLPPHSQSEVTSQN